MNFVKEREFVSEKSKSMDRFLSVAPQKSPFGQNNSKSSLRSRDIFNLQVTYGFRINSPQRI